MCIRDSNKVNVGTGITLDAAAGTIEVYNTTTEKVSTVVNPSGEANYTGIVTATGGVHVGTAATIYANGNVSCGILTATNFIGDGSGLTGVANTDNVVSTTLSVSGVVTAIGGLYVGTAASIFANGNITGGIVTATKYYGDGSSLSNVTSTTINNNANNRLITGSGTANTLEGESTLTYDGAALSVSTGATIFTNGNIACGIITATSFTVAGTSLAETIADTVGGMVSSNTESGITVAYQDADNTLDFTVGTLNQDTTGNAATATALETARNIGGVSFDGSANINLPGVNTAGDQDTSGNATTATTATNITVSANNSTDETVYPIFVDGATGGQGAETDTGLTYNPSDGNLTATTFTGALTGNVTGNASGSSGSCTGNAAGLTGTPDITVGDVVAASLDISGDADIDGTLEADAITVNGTALDTHIAGVTVTTATNATNVTAADESSDTTCFPLFVTSATGNVAPKTGSNLSFNSSSGALTATSFSGDGSNLTGTGPQEADTSVSSTSATTVLSIAHASYRGSFVKVLITQGSAYQMGNYTIIHDGTTASIIEESAIATGSMLGTFSATISGSNLLMQVTMGSSSSATVTVKADNITAVSYTHLTLPTKA